MGDYTAKCIETLKYPEEIEHLGISSTLLENVVIKLIDKYTKIDGKEIANALKIPFHNIVEKVLSDLKFRLIVDRAGKPGGDLKGGSDLIWWLTEAGKKLAAEIRESSAYCDAMPVSIATYNELIETFRFSRSVDFNRVKESLGDLVLSEETLIQIGVALNRRGSIFIYGPPGNGKTTIAKRMIKAISDDLIIPYAVETGGDVIKIFDPAYHTVIPGRQFIDSYKQKYGAGDRYDCRWIPVQTPMIVAATELRVCDLDLVYNPISKYYEAPLHVKANGGMFLIDDLGRQREPADAFLNRWIHPLEDGYDFLTLASGRQIKIPFNLVIIYSTNLDPRKIGDKAFLRRFKSRIEIKGPTREEFEEIARRICEKQGIEFKAAMIAKLIDGLCRNNEKLCACHPVDAITAVVSRAKFLGITPEFTDETVAYALTKINYLT